MTDAQPQATPPATETSSVSRPEAGSSGRSGRWAPWFIQIAATLLAWVWLIGTEPFLAMVWDEGYTLGREDRLRAWFQAMADPKGFAETWSPPDPQLVQLVSETTPTPDRIDTRAELMEQKTLRWFWRFARQEPDGHPPFYAMVGLIGDLVTPWREQLARARLGPMLLFGLTAGVLGHAFARRYGAWAALAAVGTWLVQPRLFAHAHYASYDGIVASFWILAMLCFAKAVEVGPGASPARLRIGWAIALGTLCGAAAATKLTGWLIPIPLLVWTVLTLSRVGLLTLLVGGAIGFLVLYGLIPTWWSEPIRGLERFLGSNLNRGVTVSIPSLFLGKIYQTPRESLPWYNSLVWIAITTPIGFLALGLTGVGRALVKWRSDRIGLLFVASWATLIVLRAMPEVPAHDGIRQLLAAVGALALVAGLGGAVWASALGRWGKALIVVALAEGLISIALLMPTPLSYYSPAIGGLPGADRLGVEPTYYWDAFSDEAIDWLNRETPPDRSVVFHTNPTNWFYLREVGRLRAPLQLASEFPPAWYVVQNRPGTFGQRERILLADYQPVKRISKFGVPLVLIYDYQDIIEVNTELERLQQLRNSTRIPRVSAP